MCLSIGTIGAVRRSFDRGAFDRGAFLFFFLEGKLGRKGSFDLGPFSVVVRNMLHFFVLATQMGVSKK